jgi:peptidyl-prolyl cis-trans isomerase D
MLEFLRNGVRSWYFKGLLGLLVISFAIFGVGDIFQGGIRSGAVIEVGEVEIDANKVSQAFRRQMNALTRRLGSQISVEQARQLGITDRVVDTLVTEALHDSEAASLGLAVGDKPIAERIRKEPGFRNQLGQFDRGVYEQTLSVNGYSEQDFVSRLRREISRELIVGSLTSAVPKSTQLADLLYRWREEKRVAEFITIKTDLKAEVGTPDESAQQAYHKENTRVFTAPEYRDATYIHLSDADVMNEISVPEAEIRELYDNRIDQFRVPERRTVQQMVFATEQAAKDAIGQLSEGKEFVAVAKALLKQEKDATELGEITRSSLPDTLVDPVFSLSAGQTSAPLKGPFGWHVMRVTATKGESTTPFSEARGKLRNELAKEKAVEVLFELANTLEDSLGGGASIEEAATEIGVSVKKVTMADRRGLGTDGKPLKALPQGQEFLTTVFGTPTGEDSNLVEMGSNAYLIVRVNSITPSQLRSLDTVRAQVIKAWQTQERRKLAENKAKDLLARVSAGEPLATIATELGVPVKTSTPFNRQGASIAKDLPLALVSDMFAAKIGGAASAPSGAGHMIAVLKSVQAADPNAVKAKRDALGDSLAARIADDLENQYNNALRQHHNVNINQQALNALFLQF